VDAIEIDVAASMPAPNLQLTESFELCDQANDMAVGPRDFIGEPVKRRPGPASVGIDVRSDDQQQRTGGSLGFA